MLRAQLSVLAALLSSRPRPLAAPRASRVRLQDQDQQQPAERLTDVQFAARLTLLASLRESSDGKEISRLVGELGELNVKEHGMSIFAYSRANDHESALAQLQALRSRGLAPTVLIFNAALSACAKTGAWEEALALLEEMRARRLSPELVSFNAAISACARAGRWGQALKLLSTMRKVGAPPDLVSFNGALVAAREGGQGKTALQLLTQMRDRGLAPDGASYGAALSACRRSADGKSAAMLVDTMVAEGLAPSESQLVDALGACAVSGAHGEAHALWSRLGALAAAEGRPIGVRAYSTRLHERGTDGDWRGALALLDMMGAAGVPVDASCLTQALRACGRAGAHDAARVLLERSTDAYGVVLGERAWRSAMQACGKAGAPEAALALLERAIAAGAASTSVYGAAMHAIAFQPLEDPAPAATQCVELLARMHANGVSLDLGIGNAVLHACQRANDWETVREEPCAGASLSAWECP